MRIIFVFIVLQHSAATAGQLSGGREGEHDNRVTSRDDFSSGRRGNFGEINLEMIVGLEADGRNLIIGSNDISLFPCLV